MLGRCSGGPLRRSAGDSPRGLVPASFPMVPVSGRGLSHRVPVATSTVVPEGGDGSGSARGSFGTARPTPCLSPAGSLRLCRHPGQAVTVSALVFTSAVIDNRVRATSDSRGLGRPHMLKVPGPGGSDNGNRHGFPLSEPMGFNNTAGRHCDGIGSRRFR